mgnify:FL=1
MQTEINARQALAAQCEISSERRLKGGQHVGDDVTITIKHTETGLTVVLPHCLGRSQHKRVQAGLDAIEYLLAL